MEDEIGDDDLEYGADTVGGGQGKDQHHGSASSRRACDPCRARKVGCDKEKPCTTCFRSGIECVYSVPQNNRPKRQRVLISTQYERKIDRIENRLTEVIGVLKTLAAATPHTQQFKSSSSHLDVSTPDSTATRLTLTPGTAHESTALTPATSSGHGCYKKNLPQGQESKFEGETSMAAHTDFANNFLQRAVRSNPLTDFRLEMDDTLSALRTLVETQNRTSSSDEALYPNARPIDRGQVWDRPLPDMYLTMTCLRISKEGPPGRNMYLWLCGLTTAAAFTDYVLKVMFSPDFSDAEYIIVLCGLTWLFGEMAMMTPDESQPQEPRKEDLDRELARCRQYAETAFLMLPFHLPTNVDYVVALGFAAQYCIELSKPTLAWSFTSSAAHMCLSLGLHRSKGEPDADDVFKNYLTGLFWSIYVIDKCLSVRLGRPSILQDYDITHPLPTCDPDKAPAPQYFVILSIRISRIQGRTYELLYSPTALTQPDHVRAARAQGLAEEVIRVITEKREVESRNFARWTAEGPNPMVHFYSQSDDVLYQSTLSLIYRAMPVPEGSSSAFTPACVETARTALEKHQSCMALFANHDQVIIHIYVQWTILFTPFVPFIIIFCHVVETTDAADLDRLRDFVLSLESVSNTSTATTRMQRLFRVLYNVATKYVEIKTSRDQQSAGREYDIYLNALGFGPSVGMGDAGYGEPMAQGMSYQGMASSVQGAEMGVNGAGLMSVEGVVMPQHGMQLRDWFNGNRQMLGLIEESMQ